MQIFHDVLSFIVDLMFNKCTITLGDYEFSFVSMVVGGVIIGGFFLVLRVIFNSGGDD